MTTVETVRAVVTADASQYNREIDKSSGKMSGLAKNAGRAAGKIGIAFGVAATAIGASSVKAFAGFETSMNEVKTLMPDLTEEAFAAMGDDVLNFGKKFGVLSTESIPALYQAISAGVPPGNVFDFMEVAQKAAMGGVTDLETAVDGISSVMNAYGEDVVSATEASDLMFTAVRLGKTDFSQLSAGLFQVVPAAAAMGIGFGDVTAALATLTAQGVPTRVATTQMRGALVELGKDGSKAATAFESIAGQTFPDFIAAGGDVAGAVRILGTAAEEGGTSIMNLFGSIEGGQAIQALASDIEGFEANVVAMGDSTGATEAAFEQMNQGLSASMDKIKAHVEVLMIQIGSKLAPVVAAALGWIVDNFDRFKTTAKNAVLSVVDFFKQMIAAVGEVVDKVKDLGSALLDKLQPTMDMIATEAERVADWFMDKLTPAFKKAADKAKQLGDWLKGKLQPPMEKVTGFAEDLFEAAKDLSDAFSKDGLSGVVDELKDKLEPIAPALKKIADKAKQLGDWLKDKLQPPMESVIEFAKDLSDAFSRDGLSGVVDELKRKLEPIGDWMNNNTPILAGFGAVIASVAAIFVGQMLVAMVAWIGQMVVATAVLWGQAAALIAAYAPVVALVAAIALLTAGVVWAYQNIDWFRAAVDGMVTFIKNNWKPTFDKMKEAVVAMFDVVKPMVENFVGIFVDVVDLLKALFTGDWARVWEEAKSIFSRMITAIIDQFTLLPRLAWAALSGSLSTLWDGIKGWVSDRATDLATEMVSWYDAVVGFVTGLPGAIAEKASGMFDGIKDAFKSAINWLIDKWNAIGFTLPQMEIDIPWDGRGAYEFGGQHFAVPQIEPLAAGGIVTRPTLAMIGEGGESEAVIPLSRLSSMTGNGGGSGGTLYTITVNTGIGDAGQIGAGVVDAITAYERRNGTSWRAS